MGQFDQNMELASMFRALPFAFLGSTEVNSLALQIEAGDYTAARSRLRADIGTHEMCDNWYKAETERKVLRLLKGV